ncbi:sensor histidine kinase [Tessaracoccus palaemonis]|uniref:histidine kinase n=1 Tax=Tessaracoccus palaemonis TaxID=2829499 RepID=A0ABX8SLW3_9ACTN|nr:histidine kinase [Tessaracoccus palaemonis]QXT63013.1 hypothetical protein KDB89_00540 [Tessaracoccus palaemonis]
MTWFKAFSNGALELILAALFLGVAVFARNGPREGDPYLLVVDVLAAVAVAVTGRFPRPGAALAILVAVAGMAFDPMELGLWPMTLMCCVISLMRRGRWRLFAVTFAVVFTCSVVSTYRSTDAPGAFGQGLYTWAMFDGFMLLFGLALYATARTATDRATQRHREVRMRAALELHDVVCRDLTLLAMQAEHAKVTGTSPELLDDMAARARSAGASLRATVASMSSDLGIGDQPLWTFASALESGRSVLDKANFEGQTDGDLTPSLPQAVDLAAGRILNEALFNVAQHGRAKGRWQVTAARLDTAFDFTVTNERGSSGPVKAGLGTVSLTQFARSVGGEVDVTYTEDDWICAVSLPLERAS